MTLKDRGVTAGIVETRVPSRSQGVCRFRLHSGLSCSKSGGLDIYGHLAQVPVRLPQPVDVGAEVVIIPVARLMS